MSEFLKAYMIKEVSDMIQVPVGTLRQWESDFIGVIDIPRDSKGARYYTDFEIETLKRIKTMREKKLSKEVIRELLEQRNKEVDNEGMPLMPQPSVPQMKQSEAVETLQSIKEMLNGFEDFKSALIEEIKAEIRQEVVNEVKREITINSEGQQKLIEEKSTAASEQLEGVTEALKKMETNYENEVKRRDEMILENMKLLREIKEEKQKSLWGKMFGKK